MLRKITYTLNEQKDFTPAPPATYPTRKWIMSESRYGLFHQWSCEGSDGESTPVAIVELEDGKVILVPAQQVTFVS